MAHKGEQVTVWINETNIKGLREGHKMNVHKEKSFNAMINLAIQRGLPTLDLDTPVEVLRGNKNGWNSHSCSLKEALDILETKHEKGIKIRLKIGGRYFKEVEFGK